MLTRRGRRRVYVVGLAAAVGAGAPAWAPPLLGTLPVFRIESVGVTGTVFVPPEAVVRLVDLEPGASVWDDGEGWEARVRGHPLVREARVRRSGIRAIEVRVTEVRPLAFFPADLLEPVDEDGRVLPIDPAEHGLNLPLLAVGGELSDGAVADPIALRALAALAELREHEPAFFGLISEVRPLEAGGLEIVLIESGKAERVFLRGKDPLGGLRRVELALALAGETRALTADARFEGQVVLTARQDPDPASAPGGDEANDRTVPGTRGESAPAPSGAMEEG